MVITPQLETFAYYDVQKRQESMGFLILRLLIQSRQLFTKQQCTYPFHRYYHLDEPFMKDIPFVTKTIRMLEKEPKESFAYNAIEVERSMKIKYKIK